MIWLAIFSTLASPKLIETNQFTVHSPPPWLQQKTVERVTQKVQDFLEWDIRKVPVYWYSDPKAFQKAHGLGGTVMAAAKPDGSVLLGPRITAKNFEQFFSHELTHVIVRQKYKSAIPRWLEEGLANYVGGLTTVDYKFLKSQGAPRVTSLTHAFRGTRGSRYHYHASTGVMEMIAKRCSIKDLLQLSVGKNLETYLKTYCEISDLDRDFKGWVEAKAKAGSPPRMSVEAAEEGEGEGGPWWKRQKNKKQWWKNR